MDPKSLELAQAALASAVDSITSSGVPLTAFVLVDTGSAREVHRMASRRLEDGAAKARSYAASRTDAEVAAFAVDSVIPFKGVNWDAVVIESWNFRASDGVRLGLRYGVKGRSKKAFPIGGPLELTRQGWVEVE